MKNIFDFEQNTPPVLHEEKLKRLAKEKALRQQILLLRVASVLTMLCLAIFPFFIYRDSMVLAVASIVMLAFSLMGSGLVSVIFYYKGMNVKG